MESRRWTCLSADESSLENILPQLAPGFIASKQASIALCQGLVELLFWSSNAFRFFRAWAWSGCSFKAC